MQKISSQKVEQLIELIKNKPVLYDKSERLYRNNEAKEKIWKDIAVEIEAPVSLCKTAWKSLRDQYGKYLKDSKTLSGQAFEEKKAYKYSEQLAFLKDSLQPRKTTSNYDPECEELYEVFSMETEINEQHELSADVEVVDDSLPSTSHRSRSSTPGRKKSEDEYTNFLKKLVEINKSSQEQKKDGPQKFFDGLADTVSKFDLSPLELMQFQNKIHSYSLQLLLEWQENKNKENT